MRLLAVFRHWISESLTFLMRLLPVQNRVFFYTIRADGLPLDNLKCVYDALPGKKVLFAHMLPHSFAQMLRARYYLLTSRVVVTDDYIKYLRQVRLRRSQKIVQLWHAAGAFKKFGLDAPSRLTAEDERQTHDQYAAVLASSKDVCRFYAGAFGIDENKILPLGVPRTDRLLDAAWQAQARDEVLTRAPILTGKTVYLYAPTFREKDGVVTAFDPKIDFAALNDALREDEIFVIRRHPVMREPFFDTPFSRVVDLSDLPTLSLLAAADVLVTDYSSLVFDAALLQKRMLLFCPDLHTYERDFYLDFPADVPAACITDAAALPDECRRAKECAPDPRFDSFFAAHLSGCDGHSTERAVSLIQSYLK